MKSIEWLWGRNLLKFLAMIIMTADHIGLVFNIEWLRVLGRAAFVMFAHLPASRQT